MSSYFLLINQTHGVMLGFCFSLSELHFYAVKLRIYTVCPGMERRHMGYLLK